MDQPELALLVDDVRYCGIPIMIHPLLGPRLCSVRVYHFKHWMSKAHFERIQKKWDKRYGKEMRDSILFTPSVIFMSRSNYNRLRQLQCKQFSP